MLKKIMIAKIIINITLFLSSFNRSEYNPPRPIETLMVESIKSIVIPMIPQCYSLFLFSSTFISVATPLLSPSGYLFHGFRPPRTEICFICLKYDSRIF